MVQISIDGTSALFTIRLTTYEALLQAIVRYTKDNKILPIYYLDRTKNVYVPLEFDNIEPLQRKTHVKIRLGGQKIIPYEGELNELGQKHGQGTYRWPNGRIYVGEWMNNQMHGEGIESWPNGSKYEGDFCGNRRHGHGRFIWPDGREYSGEYKDDQRHGYGVCTLPDGYRYEGEWYRGKRHGTGIEIFPDGQRFHGMFENNKPISYRDH